MALIEIRINDTDVSSYVQSCSQIPIVLRARNWKPSFNGFQISISVAVTNEPLKGESIVIKVDEDFHYRGFISKIQFNEATQCYDLEIIHELMNLELYKLDHATLHSKLILDSINPTATWDAFTVDTGNDYIVDTTHGLSSGDKIQLRTSGTLPAGLSTNIIYYVKVIDANNFRVFPDFSTYFEDTAYGSGYTGYVNITDSGSGTHEYTTDLDQENYNDWAFYRDIHYRKVAANNQFFSDFFPGNSRHPMEPFYAIQDDYFTVIMFDCEDGGSLPSPLSKDRAYIAAYSPDDDWFLVYDSFADYVSDTSISTSNDGSGEQWFSVIRRYSGDSSLLTIYPTAFVNLRFLIIEIFDLIGVELVTTDIDSIIFYRYTTEFQSYLWDDFLLMEAMLYNLNQNDPLAYSDIDRRSKISCLDFVMDIFGRLGIAIKFTGDGETNQFTLYPQERDADGVIDPANETQYIIPDDNQVQYEFSEIIDDKRGWYFERVISKLDHPSFWIGSALSFFYSDRARNLGQDIGYGRVDTLYLPEGSYNQLEDISFYRHMALFFRDLYETNGANNPRMIRESSLGTEFLDFNFGSFPYSPVVNYQQALLNHDQEKIGCQAGFLDQDLWTIKELYLDVANERLLIIQEINQLTSG